ISKLLSLIKENSLGDKGKRVQANMAVFHPNGTEALITKVTRDNKFIVGFDESKCFLMSHDLMDVKIIEIGRQVNGLYFFDNMKGFIHFKNDLFFEQTNIDNIPCQKAKQTREPFPLSEHKSSVLGELVHLDLWGPYRVVSKEGYKYFLTIVDDFTRAV
ncbi:ribonuclease H-like domain-containing protein, partial [Tanacetum coccineum]